MEIDWPRDDNLEKEFRKKQTSEDLLTDLWEANLGCTEMSGQQKRVFSRISKLIGQLLRLKILSQISS